MKQTWEQRGLWNGIHIVSSIYKEGDTWSDGNYQGISVIPLIARLFSKNLYTKLQGYLALSEEQKGFWSGKICLDNIHCVSE